MSSTTRPAARGRACRDCAAVHEHGFCPLPADLLDEFETMRATRVFDKGEFIYVGGEEGRFVFILCSGRVKLLSESAEGKVLLIRFAGVGEVLAAGEAIRDAPYDDSAVAAERSLVTAIPRAEFLTFVRAHPRASLRLTTSLSNQYKGAQRKIRFLAFGHTSSARLAGLLLEWAAQRGEPVPGGVRVALRLSQAEIAQKIGSNRETVTRLLSELSRNGVVEKGSGSITIRDSERLRRASRL
jgi:CRP-like cAMP-binding protein